MSPTASGHLYLCRLRNAAPKPQAGEQLAPSSGTVLIVVIGPPPPSLERHLCDAIEVQRAAG